MNRIIVPVLLTLIACTAATGARADAAPSSYVYQPGGTESGNVYTDFAHLVAATSSIPGDKTVLFDGSHTGGYPHVPAGTWNVDNWTMRARVDPATNLIDEAIFDEGAHLTFSALTLDRILMESESSTPVIDQSVGGFGLIARAASLYSDTGKAPFIRLTGGQSTVWGYDEFALGDGMMPAIEVDAPALLSLEVVGTSYLGANALYGDGEIDLMYDSAATLGPQASTGLRKFPASVAANVAFTAGDPTKWKAPAPGTVQEAIDRIAARMDGGL